jgi:hypothetical protein
MNRYIIVKDGIVINIVLWDGVTQWSPPEGQAIRNDSLNIGDKYN